MPGPESLLDILCCPVSHEPLRPLSGARLKKLNHAIGHNALLYVNGDSVEQPLKSALITRDGNVVYPVEQSIPVLLPDRGIGTAQLNDF